MKVDEDGIVVMLVKPVERLETVAGGIDLVTLTSQKIFQQFAEDSFVIDHKDALLSYCLVGQGINPATAQSVHTPPLLDSPHT